MEKLNVKDLEQIIFGYMLLKRDFDVKEEMFENKSIQLYIKLLKQNNASESEKEKIKEYGNAAQTCYLGYLSLNKDKSEEEIIKQLKDDLKENFYERIGLYKMVYNDFFDPRLQKKLVDEYVDTGFEKFNFYLNGGLKKKTFTGIQCTTGGGKSTMLFSIGTNMLKNSYNVAFVNLEMNIQEFNNNILSGIMSDNDPDEKFTHFRISNYYNVENQDFIDEFKKEFDKIPVGKHCVIVNEDYQKINCERIEQLLLAEEERQGIKFDAVLIDYLFLLNTFTKGLKSEQTYDYLQRIAQEAHKMAQRNNWAILSVFQTNRNGFGNDKSNAVDMAGSFNALHDMDNYFSFAREPDTNNIIIKPEKLRQYNSQDAIQQFKLTYSHDYKVYVESDECCLTAKDYKWDKIWMCDDIHNNLNVTDFSELMVSLGKNPVSKQMIYKIERKTGISHPKKSLVNWKELNVDNILKKTYRPDTKAGQMMLGISGNDLFNI